MPRGFEERPSGSGGTDYFDLKKTGDMAIIVLMAEPFLLDFHRLNDPEKQFGKQFPCGIKDRQACPICEDTTGKYDGDEMKTTYKAYYPVFVNSFKSSTGQNQVFDAMKVMASGPRLHEGFMACYKTLTEYGGEMIGTPLIITRSGEGPQTAYNVQKHPNPNHVVETSGEVPDVEKLALGWIEKEWKELGYNEFASKPMTNAPANGAGKNESFVDPFANLKTAVPA